MRFDKDYGREISFRDLFFHFLYRWRSILAAALIGAVLLGGYTYLKGHKAAVKPLSAAVEEIGSMTEDTAAEDDGSVTEETAAETGEANDRLYKRLLDETIDYCNKSVMMRVDPYAVWKAAAVYTVIPEERSRVAFGMPYALSNGNTALLLVVALMVPSNADQLPCNCVR